MTIERRYAAGWTSKGERMPVDSKTKQPVAPYFFRLTADEQERYRIMATRKNASNDAMRDPLRATPGAERGQIVDDPMDVAALRSSGPRDALVVDGHNDLDIVPDVDDKGYHTGLVRQPANVVVDGGQVVGFASDGAHGESKFAYGSLQALKAGHNKAEADGSLGDTSDPTPAGPISDRDRVGGPEGDAKK